MLLLDMTGVTGLSYFYFIQGLLVTADGYNTIWGSCMPHDDGLVSQVSGALILI